MKYDALEISLLAVLLVAELSLAFTPAFRHRHTAFIKVFPTQQLRPTSFQAPKASTEDEGMGLNELQTLLRDAVQRQDFLEAGDLSDQLFVRLYGDEMPTNDEEKRLKRKKMSWKGLGAAPWLVDRLD